MDHREAHKVSHTAYVKLIYCTGLTGPYCSVIWCGPETKLSQTVLSSRALSADWSSDAGINKDYETASDWSVQGPALCYVPRTLVFGPKNSIILLKQNCLE